VAGIPPDAFTPPVAGIPPDAVAPPVPGIPPDAVAPPVPGIPPDAVAPPVPGIPPVALLGWPPVPTGAEAEVVPPDPETAASRRDPSPFELQAMSKRRTQTIPVANREPRREPRTMWHLLPDADLASTLARSVVAINRGDQTAPEAKRAPVTAGTDARALPIVVRAGASVVWTLWLGDGCVFLLCLLRVGTQATDSYI
jgi:hypothetical protein